MDAMGLLSNPLFNAGMGLLSANTRSTTPPNYAQSVMQSLMMGQQMKQQAEESQAVREFRQMQMAQMQAAQAKQQQEAAALEMAISALPPEQQPMARANPTAFIKPPEPVNYNQPFLPDGSPNPAYQQYQIDLRNAGRTTVNTQVTNTTDPLASFTGDSLKVLSERAATAPQRQAQAEAGLNILKDRVLSGNETGKWAPLQTEVAAYLGVNPDEVATAQVFDTLMGDKVMARIDQTKGSITEREMDYFRKISPQSDKEPFTNFVLLEIDRRAALREQDKLNYVEEYIQQKGNMIGFDNWYMKNHNAIPEFDVNQLREQFDQWAKPQGGPDIDSLLNKYAP